MKKRIFAFMLVFALLVSGLPFTNFTAYAYDVEDASEADTEYVTLSGYIGGMGFEKEETPESQYLSSNFKIIAICKSLQTAYITTTEFEGEEGNSRLYYSLNLPKGYTYMVSFEGGYNSVLMGNVIHHEDNVTMNTNTTLSLLVRTKNVGGLVSGDYTPQYDIAYPNNVETTKANEHTSVDGYKKLSSTSIYLKKGETYLLETQMNSSAEYAGYTVKYDGITYTSNDESIATVDENGLITAVGYGTTTVVSSIGTTSAECKVKVRRDGFAYDVDGFSFSNWKYSFRYSDYSDGYEIPYERYLEVFGNTITQHMYDCVLKEKWDGNCFGMSMAAIELYNGNLSASSLDAGQYDEGESVNAGLYDWIKVNTEDNTHSISVVNTDSKLTKLIECYQILQDQAAFKSDYRVDFQTILDNWESGKTYMINLYCKDGDFDHAIVIDTSFEKPTADEDGNYSITVYDCNNPVFTDTSSEYYSTVDNRITQENREADEKKITYNSTSGEWSYNGSNNASVDPEIHSGDSSSIRFYDFDSFTTTEFNGQFDLFKRFDEKKKKDIISFYNSEHSIFILKWLKDEDTKAMFTNESQSIKAADNAEWEAKVSGTSQTIDLVVDADEKYLLEIPEGGKFRVNYNGAIYVVDAGANSEVVIDGDSISATTLEDQTITILSEREADDSTIDSVLVSGNSVKDNSISVNISEDGTYSIQSDEPMTFSASFNTEDSTVDETATLNVNDSALTFDFDDTLSEITSGTVSNENILVSDSSDDKNDGSDDENSGNQTTGNGSNGNQTTGNGSNGNQTTGNSSNGNQTTGNGNTAASGTTTTAANLTIKKTSYKKAVGAKSFNLGASSDASSITYKSSNKKVATVNNKGKVTIKSCGKATITVTACDATHTTTTKKITVTVTPKKSTIKSLTSKKAGQLKVTWSKQKEAAGYVIEYSTDKKFKKNTKTVTIKKRGTTSTTLKNLKKGTKYYVRVKAYTKINKKKVFGTKSKVLSKKVKK